MIYVVMGVSGCGKSSVGRRLAEQLALPFYDGDDFHPARNIEKLRDGIPLEDADRLPWLRALACHIEKWERSGGAVLACSALRETYRSILREGAPGRVRFVWLDVDSRTVEKRLQLRQGHFMAASLLESQYETLEPPTDALRICLDKLPEPVSNGAVETVLQVLDPRQKV